LFTNGCNLSCPYCHNPTLISPSVVPPDFLSREEVMSFLQRRRGVLTAVCITGGEPTIHDDLAGLIEQIHELGLKVKVDTNGTLPHRLEALEVDYVAMDLKTAPSKYERVATYGAGAASGAETRTGAGSDAGAAPGGGTAARIRRAAKVVRGMGVTYEFRTTVVPGIVDQNDMEEICESLEPGDSYTLAQFRPLVTLDPSYESVTPYPIEELEAMQQHCLDHGIDAHVRIQ